MLLGEACSHCGILSEIWETRTYSGVSGIKLKSK